MKNYTRETLLVDYFPEDYFIEVQCRWLQNELKEGVNQLKQINQYKDTISKLLAKIDGLEARLELTELLNSKVNFKFDERA